MAKKVDGGAIRSPRCIAPSIIASIEQYVVVFVVVVHFSCWIVESHCGKFSRAVADKHVFILNERRSMENKTSVAKVQSVLSF